MNIINGVDPAQTYINGMSWAAYGATIFSCSIAEWQLDFMKEYAKKRKVAEIDYSALTSTEKEEQKHQWKQWLDATTQGFKDVLRAERRLV